MQISLTNVLYRAESPLSDRPGDTPRLFHHISIFIYEFIFLLIYLASLSLADKTKSFFVGDAADAVTDFADSDK